MKTNVVLVSAGKGLRFMDGKKKQFFPLAGKPILAHTLDRFEKSPLIDKILLVVGEQDMEYCLEEIVEKYGYRKVSRIIPGGKERQDSVRNGVDAVPEDVEIIMIHDGVRPFITEELIEQSIRLAIRSKAVVAAVPVKDTIKEVNPGGSVVKTLERNALWQIQTPQTFQAGVIKKALRQASEDGFYGTDDASLVERLGVEVHIVQGSYRNIKITTPDDLLFANLLLQFGPESQISQGSQRR